LKRREQNSVDTDTHTHTHTHTHSVSWTAYCMAPYFVWRYRSLWDRLLKHMFEKERNNVQKVMFDYGQQNLKNSDLDWTEDRKASYQTLQPWLLLLAKVKSSRDENIFWPSNINFQIKGSRSAAYGRLLLLLQRQKICTDPDKVGGKSQTWRCERIFSLYGKLQISL
jgi:hypothetical protein